MNRWAARIMGLLMLLVFLLALVYLQKQLIAVAKQRGVNTSTVK
jgi:hypothetical protein